jgi:hypothetical protein
MKLHNKERKERDADIIDKQTDIGRQTPLQTLERQRHINQETFLSK